MFRKLGPRSAGNPPDEAAMTPCGAALRVRVLPAITEIPPEAWDRCAGTGASANPFTRHAFLAALEASKSATARTGWQPQHLIAERGGAIIGVVPCYLKSHSRGEYVFDAGWADAYERAGGSYYPKLQVAVPFTPATGRRLLVRPCARADEIRRALAGGLVELCRIDDASGVHVTFAAEDDYRLLGGLGFLQRSDQQFHWDNPGYDSFDDFLAALAARKRKTIRR